MPRTSKLRQGRTKPTLEGPSGPSASGTDLVAALAVEGGLSRRALVALADQRDGPDAVGPWLETEVKAGRLRSQRPRMSAVIRGDDGVLFALPADRVQVVLRELVIRGEVWDVLASTRRVLGHRSRGELRALLVGGDIAGFDRLVERLADSERAEAWAWLRDAICDAFDPGWLQTTFADPTAVVVRALSESLAYGRDCSALFAWAAANRSALEPTSALDLLLSEHALWRGRLSACEELAGRLSRGDALPVLAAAAFARGELETAFRRCADIHLRATKKNARPMGGSLAPLLALVAMAQAGDDAVARARNMVGGAKTDADKRMGQALRALLRLETKGADASPKRNAGLDVYHLPKDATVWQILLGGLTAHLHVQRPATRAGWAVRLVQHAAAWSDAGYSWLAGQTLLLARDHDRAAADVAWQQLSELEVREPPVPVVSLWDCLTPKPAWRRALERLDVVSDELLREESVAHRVVWYVDMTTGRLTRPALQRYGAETFGWTTGHRVDVAELRAMRLELPPEDRSVVDACPLESDAPASAWLPAVEALVGHSRVLRAGDEQGARVDVVRRTCRVEVTEDGGGFRLNVEPRGAELGLNVSVESPERLAVYRVDEALSRVISALPVGVRVPKADEPALLAVLHKLATRVEVRSPQLGAERAVEADATPCIRMASRSGGWQVQIGVKPFGDAGRFFAAAGGPRSLQAVVEGRRVSCRRAFEQETENVAKLVASLTTLTLAEADAEDDASFFFGEDEAVGLLADLAATDVAHVLEWQGTDKLKLATCARHGSVQGQLRCIKGWYVAEGDVRLDDETKLRLRELCRAPTLAGGRFVRIGPGEYVELEASVRRITSALRAAVGSARGPLQLDGSATWALELLAASGFSTDRDTASWLARVADARSATHETPDLKATLRPYQLHGYQWLCALGDLGLGACLADDMGLGKTLQVLAVIGREAKRERVLVVAPTSVCSNWLTELRRFAPSLQTVDYAGPRREDRLRAATCGVVVCSYAVLQQDAQSLAAQPWAAVVLDEAQYIKNAKSIRARAAYRLSSPRRIVATGTPIENNLGDLWSVFRFLQPGLLGDWKIFKSRFARPIEQDGSEHARAELRALIGPYVLRRRKEEVLEELPPITEVVVDVSLSAVESALYEKLETEIRERLFTAYGRRQNKLDALSEITRLRRFCCHPRLVFPHVDVTASKTAHLLAMVEELRQNGHRALVFSQYVDFLTLVCEQLNENGIRYEYLDGSSSRAERERAVTEFQEGDAELFVMSLKAGGLGLNLTAADYVIHLDPWWNPAAVAQATDRAHRIGQQRPVTAYQLVAKGTIEEKVVRLQSQKSSLADGVLEDLDMASRATVDELIDLLVPNA